MQNILQFGQFGFYYYPIWVDPRLRQNQSSYFSSVTFSPQIPPPCINHLSTNSLIQDKKKQRQGQQVQTIDKQDRKEESKEIKFVIETHQQKKVKQPSKKSIKNNLIQSTKVKRPQTYETQKSYYMKQKIKGKLKSKSRILRKRNNQSQEPCLKNKLRATKVKVVKQERKEIKKKHTIVKEEVKQQKSLKKLKQKITKQYIDGEARIPYLIMGVKQINEFIRVKIEGLKIRQLMKK